MILQTLITDFPILLPNLIVTLRTTVIAFLAAAVIGLLLGLLFTFSRWVERTLFSYAVILQVTPIVAIAPLIIIWVNNTQIALLICAWIVAFFPIVSNTAVGLNSTDRNLIDLYRLYGASKAQTLFLLKLPSALPYYLAGFAHFGRPCADRRGSRGVCRRHGRYAVRLGLPYPGIGLSARDSPHVHGVAPDLTHGDRDLRLPVRALELSLEELA